MEPSCSTCLSRGRKMYYIGDLQLVLQYLTPELQDVITTLNICWECRAVLKKLTSFREQVLQAHTMMINQAVKQDFEDYTNPWEEGLNTFSTLTTKLKTDFDYTVESVNYNSNSDNDNLDADNEIIIPPTATEPKKVLKKVKILKIDSNMPLFDGKGNLIIKNVQANLTKADVTNKQTNTTTRKTKTITTKLKSETSDSDIEENIKLSLIKKSTNKTFKKVVKNKVGIKRKKLKLMEVQTEKYVPPNSEILDFFGKSMRKALHANDCYNVNISIMTAEELQEHRDSLKSEPNYSGSEYKCEKCIVGYYTEEQLDDHVKVKHQKGNKIHSLLCPICNSFIDKSMYLFHYGRHVVCYTCTLCQHKVVDIKEMRAHQVKHKNETNTYYCEKCTMEFKTSYHLRLHNNRRHGEPMIFKRPGLVKRGIPKETSSRSYDCVLCDYKFQSRGKMKQHVETVHSSQETKYHCSKCDITCNSFLSYKKHFRYTQAHINDSPGKVKYICPYCGKPFTVNFIMREHINYVHNGKTDYVCHICNKMLSSKGSLTKHIKYVHEGIKQAKDRPCNVCGKFYNAATLRSHIRIHSDARPFICKICGDSFKQSGSLYTHIRLKHKRGNKDSQNVPGE